MLYLESFDINSTKQEIKSVFIEILEMPKINYSIKNNNNNNLVLLINMDQNVSYETKESKYGLTYRPILNSDIIIDELLVSILRVINLFNVIEVSIKWLNAGEWGSLNQGSRGIGPGSLEKRFISDKYDELSDFILEKDDRIREVRIFFDVS
jgi:hypothetical protein